jgi:hypothetical protein
MKRLREKIFGRTTMSDEGSNATETTASKPAAKGGRFLGSLKEALAAAGREDTQREPKTKTATPTASPAEKGKKQSADKSVPSSDNAALSEGVPATGLSAAEAAREVKAQTSLKAQEKNSDHTAPPTTRVVRGMGKPHEDSARTQLVRGKVKVERGAFEADPVVGWLVVVGGPGIGCYRAIFEGNNTLGRNSSQRIPLDFGDDTISSEEQAYIRYDSSARSFLFVPNLTKTNVVSVNDNRPTGAVELNHMDVITVGRTQLVFVPFCGADFDWAELADAKS